MPVARPTTPPRLGVSRHRTFERGGFVPEAVEVAGVHLDLRMSSQEVRPQGHVAAALIGQARECFVDCPAVAAA
jgi:hypothetical protein